MTDWIEPAVRRYFDMKDPDDCRAATALIGELKSAARESDPLTTFWIEHYVDPAGGLCKLCKTSGFLRTHGGDVDYCICPNGRALRSAAAENEESER